MKKSLAGANENSRRLTPGTRMFTGHTRRKSAGSIPLTTTDSPNPKNLGGRGAPLRFSRPRRAIYLSGTARSNVAHPKKWMVPLRVSADAQADMPSAGASGAICVQRFDDSLTSCNSHYVSHFAAFFIVARAKISVVEGCNLLRVQSVRKGHHS